MDDLDDKIQDEIDVYLYQYKEVIDRYEEGGFNKDGRSYGENISQDIESYTSKYHINVQI